MKILVFAPDIPATTNMPGSPRLFNLCKWLAADHRLTLVTYPGDAERYAAFRADPASPGVFDEIVFLPTQPVHRWWGRQLHRLRQEAHWVTRFRAPAYHAELRSRIRALVVEGGFDLLFVDYLWNAQYVVDNDIPCPAVIDLHDSMTLLYSRKAQLEQRPIERLRLRMETGNLRRWEGSLSRTFGAVITNSSVDADQLRSLDPAANVVTIGNGVDCEFFSPSGGAGDPSRMVFTGVMDYGPNEDAAVHFIEDIFPGIRATHPEASIEIVGKGPTDQVLALGSRPGVTIVGEVPDVRPYLQAAGIFVCPLRWGAGVKNKLLAALAMEKPVVASRRSAEGLDVRDGVDLLLADGPVDFAEKVARLMDDPGYASELARAGRQVVTRTYSWESSARALEQVMLGLVERPDAARR